MGAHGRLRIGACLSLTGRFAPFGQQAADGLRAWAELEGHAEVLIEDDASDVRQLRAVLPDVAARCELLLGPYSTVLMRAAGDVAADAGWLVWNHGGSGDDVQTDHPGHVISVLTPASRYMEPFLSLLAAVDDTARELRIAHATGRFGRQVATGAAAFARQLGFARVVSGPADEILTSDLPRDWILVSAGTFEDDVETVTRARKLNRPPRAICAVAAGVHEFCGAVDHPDGTYGIAQWFPAVGFTALVGPAEADFLDAYSTTVGETPDYPAIQAAAAASIAIHCARQKASTEREVLWSAAAELDTATLYGAFSIDRITGAQASHETVLTRWADKKLVAAGGQAGGRPVRS